MNDNFALIFSIFTLVFSSVVCYIAHSGYSDSKEKLIRSIQGKDYEMKKQIYEENYGTFRWFYQNGLLEKQYD